MNTIFLLMAEFETSTIPLSDIAERYFGMKPATADKKAGAGDLPVPTFRIGDSQKAPRMVHVNDLADFIDKRRGEAKTELARIKQY
ncbi:pyocin activator PrtN family protein [Yersinia proxima]|uniref:pyocin activator PrtN family protein n=1 Tax=Yersinia proxima TaxID=2890316 RepID=UPI003D699714